MAGKRSAARPAGALDALRLSAGQWVACVVTALSIIGSLGGYLWYQGIANNITTAQVDTDAWDRPTSVEGVMNLLVIGSDVRSGENANYGEVEGERPDMMLIASINVDSGSVTMVNLPRDLVVDLPACEQVEGYQGMAAQSGMINSAMTFGGVGCQWNTVEQVTGVHLDHFVMMDFTGFKDMVDAVGGVQMCIPSAIDDPKAHLVLEAGDQTLDGEQSLGYVRSRYGQGDGSDLSRIERQQQFMGAMLRQVLSSEVMTSPLAITNFLNAVTESVTADDEFTVDTMTDIAISMREVDLKKIQFVTVPNGQHPADANRLALSEPAASELFAAINSGADLSGGEEEAEEPQEAPADAPDPADISLDVLNGTAVEGLASQVAERLTSDGYTVVATGNPEVRVPAVTTVYHAPGQEAAAELLAKSLETAVTEEAAGLTGTLELVLGPDWTGFKGDESSADLSVTDDLGGITAEAEPASAC
ncbi:LCP family protein [Nocardiopsis flavescens]|uniref:Cell envelope-related function transcriptional attenuator common domain-containing protein n=1 Tax=Nocardiopsis flavescens TaxID=758803 RepID=A0A1M6RCS8_9ACTN|nr:LCP family protein [Nocardiopsis flavescens]SHK30274.1 cell envelope-related function transcriptional attenuator common domain-containing protein [Nocardiopsis flavescens]